MGSQCSWEQSKQPAQCFSGMEDPGLSLCLGTSSVAHGHALCLQIDGVDFPERLGVSLVIWAEFARLSPAHAGHRHFCRSKCCQKREGRKKREEGKEGGLKASKSN